MGSTIHVFDYLAKPPAPAPVNVVFGDEPFFKQLVLPELRRRIVGDTDIPYGEYEGDSVEWRDVLDELSTVSLFSAAGARLVIVRNADKMVTKYRGRMEDYFGKPEQGSALVLEVSKWAANTKLYKLADEFGLQIACRAPQAGKSIDHNRVIAWLVQWAQDRHGMQLERHAAVQLVDLIGLEFGLLDQELAKLALYAGADNRITETLVQQYAGGWATKTVWDILDTALAGDAAGALQQLNRLYQAGQDPNALFGPISWSLRRFAAATRVYQRAERAGRRMRLPDALKQGGFHGWQVAKGEPQLRRLGRHRAGRLYQQLLETDLALKGSHSAPTMARLAIENLLVQIAKKNVAT